MRVTGGIRAIAILEAAKGAVVLLLGLGLLSLPHYSDIFIYVVSRLHGVSVPLLAMGAFAYAGVRLAEAYGLWYERRWAEWLAAFSGAIYIPFVLYELTVRATWLKAGALALNVAIVAFMLYSLSQTRRLQPGA